MWIRHADGDLSKYTHFATGTVQVARNDVVSTGTVLSLEGDVGQATASTCISRSEVPDDPNNPINGGGFLLGYNLDPVICGIPVGSYEAGSAYTAAGC